MYAHCITALPSQLNAKQSTGTLEQIQSLVDLALHQQPPSLLETAKEIAGPIIKQLELTMEPD